MNKKETRKFLSSDRIWVWPDHPKATDSNAGTFEKPLKTYETAQARAELETIIIVIPEKAELFKEKYKDLYPD